MRPYFLMGLFFYCFQIWTESLKFLYEVIEIFSPLVKDVMIDIKVSLSQLQLPSHSSLTKNLLVQK